MKSTELADILKLKEDEYHMKKRLFVAILAILMLLTSVASLAEWFQEEEGGAYYYLDKTGAKVTRWQKIGGKWYYFDPVWGNEMATGREYWINGVKHDFANNGVWLGENNKKVTGWKHWGNNQWGYRIDDEYVHDKWIKHNNKWYYIGSEGLMVRGEYTINGKVEHFDKYGVWTANEVLNAKKLGWKHDSNGWRYVLKIADDGTEVLKKSAWHKHNNKWYYFDANGIMVTKPTKIGGAVEQFDKYGVWTSTPKKNGWAIENNQYVYYVNGKYYEGWLKLGKKWYYLYPGSHTMATGFCTIDGSNHEFAGSGEWLGYR